jgi:hypothetical protein
MSEHDPAGAAYEGSDAATPAEGEAGFFMRWVMPILLAATIIAAMMVLTRVSTPVLEAGDEVPESHPSAACGLCHRGSVD